MVKTVSQDVIDRELKELKDKISCNNAYAAEEWSSHLPGISPNELVSMFRHCPGEPKINVIFPAADKERRSYASVVVTDKNASRMENANDVPFYLSFDVLADQVFLHKCNVGSKYQGNSMAKTLLATVRDIALIADKPRLTVSTTAKGAYAWSRFGFTPAHAETWRELKKMLQEKYLNKDRTAMRYPDYMLGTFAQQIPEGFTLRPEETQLLNDVFASENPRDIYLLSDMGRVLSPEGYAPPVTVGKALLCGLSWKGELILKEGNPGYERFCNYVSPAVGRSQYAEAKGAAL